MIGRHPAGRARACTTPGCGQTAIARATWPQTADTDPTWALAIIRPLTNATSVGTLLCLDCTHAAVDVTLIRATPKARR